MPTDENSMALLTKKPWLLRKVRPGAVNYSNFETNFIDYVENDSGGNTVGEPITTIQYNEQRYDQSTTLISRHDDMSWASTQIEQLDPYDMNDYFTDPADYTFDLTSYYYSGQGGYFHPIDELVAGIHPTPAANRPNVLGIGRNQWYDEYNMNPHVNITRQEGLDDENIFKKYITIDTNNFPLTHLIGIPVMAGSELLA